MATIPAHAPAPPKIGRLEKEPFLELVHRARSVADELGETRVFPRQMVTRLAQDYGYEFIKELQQQAEQIEAQGGVMTPTGDRRRTLGGVFFMLAKERLGAEGFADAERRTERYLRKRSTERKQKQASTST